MKHTDLYNYTGSFLSMSARTITKYRTMIVFLWYVFVLCWVCLSCVIIFINGGTQWVMMAQETLSRRCPLMLAGISLWLDQETLQYAEWTLYSTQHLLCANQIKHNTLANRETSKACRHCSTIRQCACDLTNYSLTTFVSGKGSLLNILMAGTNMSFHDKGNEYDIHNTTAVPIEKENTSLCCNCQQYIHTNDKTHQVYWLHSMISRIWIEQI